MIGTITAFVIPVWIVLILCVGIMRNVPLVTSFVAGAQEGFGLTVRMLPHVVAMMVAIAVFRASGALDALVGIAAPWLDPMGIPAQVVPMGLLRTMTGAGSIAYAGDVIAQYGPDALWSRMVATIQGSTDTTLYVIAVYFGAIGVTKTRYALPVGLAADAVGFVAAVWACRVFS